MFRTLDRKSAQTVTPKMEDLGRNDAVADYGTDAISWRVRQDCGI